MAALGRLPSVQAATAGLSAPMLDGPPNWAERQSALTHRPNSGTRPTPQETAFRPQSGAAGPPPAWSCCGGSPSMRRTVLQERPGLAGRSSFKSSTFCAAMVRCFASRLSPADDQDLLGIASEGVGRSGKHRMFQSNPWLAMSVYAQRPGAISAPEEDLSPLIRIGKRFQQAIDLVGKPLWYHKICLETRHPTRLQGEPQCAGHSLCPVFRRSQNYARVCIQRPTVEPRL
jgi:hypothetical protein